MHLLFTVYRWLTLVKCFVPRCLVSAGAFWPGDIMFRNPSKVNFLPPIFVKTNRLTYFMRATGKYISVTIFSPTTIWSRKEVSPRFRSKCAWASVERSTAKGPWTECAYPSRTHTFADAIISLSVFTRKKPIFPLNLCVKLRDSNVKYIFLPI